MSCCSEEHSSASSPDPRPPIPPTPQPGAVRSRLLIEQMDCPTEEGMIRSALSGMAGIQSLEFNLIQRVLTVDHLPDKGDVILAAIRKLGFAPLLLEEHGPRLAPAAAPRMLDWRLGLAGVGALLAEVLHLSGWAGSWVIGLLAVISIALSGVGTYRKGWQAIRQLNLNINGLMSVAVTGALLIGEWPEAAMVMFLFAFAERIEARSLDRARHAIGGLMAMTPERATSQLANGSWQEQDVAQIAVGALIRVRPGERIGLDAEVMEGHSSVNQAPVTGESMPVDKSIGDQVFAGTVNQEGSLICRVTAQAADSTLARIIRAVEQAQSQKAPTQRLVDRFARIYTPAVFLLALMVALVPPLLGGDWHEWIYRALVMLVVACPCALVISTPVTVVSGLTAAARRGILVKGGVYLENGAQLQCIALDKTGTLTSGEPEQTDAIALDTAADEHLLRGLAASLASRSDHPVSIAIAHRAVQDGIALQPVETFAALPGRGVQGPLPASPMCWAICAWSRSAICIAPS